MKGVTDFERSLTHLQGLRSKRNDGCTLYLVKEKYRLYSQQECKMILHSYALFYTRNILIVSVACRSAIYFAIKFKVGMCLPAGPYVSDDDVRYIVETIKNAIM